MSTIGELSDIGVADLIEIIDRHRKTGRLAVKTGEWDVRLYFAEGRLIRVSSSDLTLRLGRMLVRQGVLSSTQLLDALTSQVEGGRRQAIGTILLDRRWVTVDELRRCAEEQSIEILARLIGDQRGLFVFDADVPPPAHGEGEALDPEALLQAARERSAALRALRERLPEPQTLLVPATGTEGLPPDVPLAEAAIIAALRVGPQPLAELAWHVALDERTFGEATLRLIERGLVLPAPDPRAGRLASA